MMEAIQIRSFIFFYLDGQGTLTAAGKVGRTFERDDVRSSKCVIPQTSPQVVHKLEQAVFPGASHKVK